MRVIVCGSRKWHDRRTIEYRLAEFPDDTVIVVGYNPEKDTPKGVDRIAYQEAQKLGLEVEPHPADWDGFTYEDYKIWGKKGAGRKRNAEMALLGADLCLAFWDGHSSGTQDMLTRAKTLCIPLEVVLKDDSGRD